MAARKQKMAAAAATQEEEESMRTDNDHDHDTTTTSMPYYYYCWIHNRFSMFYMLPTKLHDARQFAQIKFQLIYHLLFTCLLHLLNILLLSLLLWLDSALRGTASFLCMGTVSFLSVFWCTIFSTFAMLGFFKPLLLLAIATIVLLFFGFAFAILLIAISGVALLWFYGSFWTTTLVILLGGLAFLLKLQGLALLITTVYSVYCTLGYVGWRWMLLALNLSFISSDVLSYFVENNMNQQTSGMEGQPASFNGMPSNSGTDTETTSEEEVARLLSCTDHYSALGFSRYENIDVVVLRREYRKKAMLVHPDKNMGNEKAAEAFKKLQNAYEVLPDSLKRKAYDDDLRREDLLMTFNWFQTGPQEPVVNFLHMFCLLSPFYLILCRVENMASFHRYFHAADGEDPIGDSKGIACKKCGNFHVWIFTKKSKCQASFDVSE
ncbi:hypothetical protein ACFE04_013560 [Oxalis oulophora]